MQGGFSKDSNAKPEQKQGNQGVYFPFLISALKESQANSAKDGVLRVKSVIVKKIILTGRLMKTIQTNKSWTLIINDTTGDLSVSFNKLPISSCPSALEGLTLVDGETYLKVICEMRLIADQAYFMCEHAEVVKDYNLITNQLLSYVHAMLSVDNDVKLDAPEPMQAEASQPIRSAIKAEYNGPHGLPKFEHMLRDLFGNLRKDKLSIDEIKRHLRTDFPDLEVHKHLDDLESNGDMTLSTTGSLRYYEFTS